jgi:FHA domain
MSSVHADCIDLGQPALFVQHGNTPRKWRPLKNDVVVVGRSHGCDIELTSEQIGPVHCILARVGRGWLLRDCGSLVGTYVNGQKVHEAVLSHGDAIQLGIFGFTTHFPDDTPLPRTEPPPESSPRPERSRRKLAKLALSLRRKLRASHGKASPPNTANLADQLRELGERTREYELRVCQLEKAERELALDREAIAEGHARLKEKADRTEREWAQRKAEVEEAAQRAERELAQRKADGEEEFKRAQRKLARRKADAEQKLRGAAREVARCKGNVEEEAQRAERDLIQRKADVEAEIAKAWEAFRARCAQVEQAANQSPTTGTDEEAARLDLRRRELDFFAAHLHRTRQRLREQEMELAQERARLAQQRTAALQAERQNRRKGEAGPKRMPVLLTP